MSKPSWEIVEAAAWAAERLPNDAAIRDAAAVAGRVQVCGSVSHNEAVAAWLYRVCELPTITVEAQASYLDEITAMTAETSPGVNEIVRSLVVPPKSTNGDIKQAYIRSSPSARCIRACETIVGIAQAVTLLAHGSVNNLDSITVLLDFAKFVYNNSQTLDPATRTELGHLVARLNALWQAVDATSRAFYEKLAPPSMLPVRILAVVTETEMIGLTCLPVDAGPSRYRLEFDALREKVGGHAVTESVLEATLPLPKWGTAVVIASEQCTITASGTNT